MRGVGYVCGVRLLRMTLAQAARAWRSGATQDALPTHARELAHAR